MASVISPPAAMPCNARETTSMVMLWAMPQSAEPTRNVASEISSSRLRPWRSPSLPHSGVVAAAAMT